MTRQIVCTSGYCAGSPRIDNTRLTCANVVEALCFQSSIAFYLNTHNYLIEDDIRECLKYCANQKCLFDQPDNFCEGCVLDLRKEIKPEYFLDNPEIFKWYTETSESKGHAFLGTEDEYKRHCVPKEMWKLAKQCLEDLDLSIEP